MVGVGTMKNQCVKINEYKRKNHTFMSLIAEIFISSGERWFITAEQFGDSRNLFEIDVI